MKYTKDQEARMELLHKALLDDFSRQEKQRQELHAKMTYLFGFTVSVITVYGTYATSTSIVIKKIALVLFMATLVLLCFAYRVRPLKKPGAPTDEDLQSAANSAYYDTLYAEARATKAACAKNKKPLKSMVRWTRWSLWMFTAGVICLALSFVLQGVTVHLQNWVLAF
jgi:hypothetical protein